MLVEAVGTQITERMEWDQGVLSHEPQVLGPGRPPVDAARPCGPTTSTSPSSTTASASTASPGSRRSASARSARPGDFLDGGKNIARDGLLPLNTHGGQLSHGRTHGMGLVHEAVTQLRGDGGDRQVADADIAVVTSGGLTPGSVLLLRRED